MFTFPIGFTAKKETTANSSRYWKFQYDKFISEIQLSFDGSRTPVPLLTSSGYSVVISAGGTSKLGELNDNNFGYNNTQYIGSTSIDTTILITLPTAKNVTSCWLHPQPQNVSGGTIYNKPTYFKIYRSDDSGNTWTLIKHYVFSGSEMSTAILYEFLI